jgi:uncharacterized membrane protein HdeD (DUF308 family)
MNLLWIYKIGMGISVLLILMGLYSMVSPPEAFQNSGVPTWLFGVVILLYGIFRFVTTRNKIRQIEIQGDSKEDE